jgi:soluble lytic murein transglycosylase-like protein
MHLQGIWSKQAITTIGLMVSVLSAHALPIDPQVYACLSQASAKHKIPLPLILAIAETESGFNPKAIRQPYVAGNRDGSVDFGLMQINSSWLPKLAKYGIGMPDLFNPCINADVGGWILGQNIARMGYNWNAVGAYNAVSPDKRVIYASRVSSKMHKYLGAAPNGKATAAAAAHVSTQQAIQTANSNMSIWEAQP